MFLDYSVTYVSGPYRERPNAGFQRTIKGILSLHHTSLPAQSIIIRQLMTYSLLIRNTCHAD